VAGAVGGLRFFLLFVFFELFPDFFRFLPRFPLTLASFAPQRSSHRRKWSGIVLPKEQISCAIFDGRNKNYLLDSLDHGVYCVPTNCGLAQEFHH
jgi:hypothetical protein